MVFKSIERIKAALPEVFQVVMFYDDGTVFQTTFDSSKNIPKLGENLAESLDHIRTLIDICQIEIGSYKKLVYETKDITLIILKLGENSNIALFLKNLKEEDLDYHSIRRYLYRIERLIDMDRIELDKEELKEKEDDLHKLQDNFNSNLDELEKLKLDLDELENELNKNRENLEIKENQLKTSEELLNIRKKELKEKDLSDSEIKKIEEELEDKEAEMKKYKEEIDLIKTNLKQNEENKQKLSEEIKNYFNKCEILKQDISKKTKYIQELKEKIEKIEKEKFEEKFLG